MQWLNNLLVALHVNLRNVLHDRVDMLKSRIKDTKLKRTLVRYLGLALLNTGKPFTHIGNWFWKKHRTVLNWDK